MKLDSTFVEFEACPKCHIPGRTKVFGRYNDGHGFCYYCGHYEPPNTVVLENSNTEKHIHLPFDATESIGAQASLWLRQYDITRQEVVDHDIEWSPYKQMLIFPYYGVDKQLLAWQGRDFSPNPKSKWYSQGDLKSILHLVGEPDDTLVIVEDIVSAIKVSRQYQVLPIFGSYVNAEYLTRLKNYAKMLVFWFDPDAKLKAFKSSQTARMLGFESKVIISAYDPKLHTDMQIKGYLDAR